jgi:hypothetical protein
MFVVFSGVIVFDMPQGFTQEVWDVLLSNKKFNRVLKQIMASQSANECVILIWHAPTETGNVQEVLKENGYQDFMNYYWVRPDHHSPTPASTYTTAMEQATIGYFPCRSKCFSNMNQDPRLRSNVAYAPAVTNYHKDQDGKVVNPCQKPSVLFRDFCQRHCPPGSNVLVVGGGALGDVIGGVEAGCNVVAVDSDARQFMCMQKIIVDFDEELTLAIKGENEEKEEADTNRLPDSAEGGKETTAVAPARHEAPESLH